ncbi:MAG: helicase-related protein, partial [Pseudobdellovibrio sp.]
MITLPIDSHLKQITHLLNKNSSLVLTASPGSGKTTRFPAHLLKTLLPEQNKKIIVIVPKRVSAVSAADRIAQENNWSLGTEVGYQVRFESKISTKTQLIFMTEGVFLKRIQNTLSENSVDFWSEIHTLIIDEFHERSTSIDIILGLAYEQKILGRNFNLTVMSATLNADQIKNYLETCDHYDIQAPPHKLEVFYSDKTQRLMCDDQFYTQLKDTLVKAWKTAKKDILVFLPGQHEINYFRSVIQPLFPQTQIETLHGSISLADQKRIVKSAPDTNRRIILSTNVAESSLTISGLDCVIDSGLEKSAYTEPKVGFSGLSLQRISLFSATQRAGRAAREQNGFCFKLWHPTDERSMKEQIEPEVLTSTLIEECLLLYGQDIQDISKFSWLTQPPKNTIKTAQSKLLNWKLIDTKNNLTPLAKLIIHWPLSLQNSILHYYLSLGGFKVFSAKLIAHIENGTLDLILKQDQSHTPDLEKIINFKDQNHSFKTEQIIKTEKQILGLPVTTLDKT